jgi:hypothetical protein
MARHRVRFTDEPEAADIRPLWTVPPIFDSGRCVDNGNPDRVATP